MVDGDARESQHTRPQADNRIIELSSSVLEPVFAARFLSAEAVWNGSGAQSKRPGAKMHTRQTTQTAMDLARGFL